MKGLKWKRLWLAVGVSFLWNYSAVPAGYLAGQAVNWGQVLPAGDGKGYVETLCSSCHSLEKVVMLRRTEEEWLAVIGKMVGEMGAQLSEWEIEEVVSYLGEHWSPLLTGGIASQPQALDESDREAVDWAMLLPKDSAKAFVVLHCTTCHGLDIIVRSRKSQDAWFTTVTWMIDEFSAPIPDQDIDPIVDYLSLHAGENNPITQVPMDLNLVPAHAFQRLGFLTRRDIDRLLSQRSQRKFQSMEEFRQGLNLDEETFRLSRIYLQVR